MPRQEYWQDGKKHREDGPAVMIPGFREEWYRNGRLHREDGPAVMLEPQRWNRREIYTPFGFDKVTNWECFARVDKTPRSFFDYLESILASPMANYGDFGAQPQVVLKEMGFLFPHCGPTWRVSDEWVFDRDEFICRIHRDARRDSEEPQQDRPRDTQSLPLDQRNDDVIDEVSVTNKSIFDLLGSYSPTEDIITLYSGPIFEAALVLDRELKDLDSCGNTLATIVFLHELGHAVDFTARIGSSLPSNAYRKKEAKRPAMMEALAQYFTWTAMEMYGTRAKDVFLALEKRQPPTYRNWRNLGQDSVGNVFKRARR